MVGGWRIGSITVSSIQLGGEGNRIASGSVAREFASRGKHAKLASGERDERSHMPVLRHDRSGLDCVTS